MVYLRIIRLPNLGIVAFTQVLFYFFILKVFTYADQTPVLDATHFALLIGTTLFIAAGGYVINDWYDQRIDQINKPQQLIIGKSLSAAAALRYYIFLIIAGALLALYLAIHVRNIGLFLLYPAAAGLLWWYSYSLKRRPLSGNLVVALFTAFVPGIVWFAERAGFSQLDSVYGVQMRKLFLFYMVFAFSATLFREIIKDLEDVKGDQFDDCQTLPIVFGVERAQRVAGLVASGILGIVSYWLISQWPQLNAALKISSLGLLLIPNIVLAASAFRAKTKSDFHRCSQWTKWWMVAGLMYLLLFLLLR